VLLRVLVGSLDLSFKALELTADAGLASSPTAPNRTPPPQTRSMTPDVS
jgi:hypothetical protein